LGWVKAINIGGEGSDRGYETLAQADEHPPALIMLAGLVLNALLGWLTTTRGTSCALLVLRASLCAVTCSRARRWGDDCGHLCRHLVTADIAAGLFLFRFASSGLEHPHPPGSIPHCHLLLAALRKAMQRLEDSSSTDNLTGAANSAFFYEALAMNWSGSADMAIR